MQPVGGNDVARGLAVHEDVVPALLDGAYGAAVDVETRVGDGYFGWPEVKDGFDIIIMQPGCSRAAGR